MKHHGDIIANCIRSFQSSIGINITMLAKQKRAANKVLGQRLTQQRKEKQRKLKNAPCSVNEYIMRQQSKHCCNCRRSRVEGITDVQPLFLYKVDSKQLKKKTKENSASWILQC